MRYDILMGRPIHTDEPLWEAGEDCIYGDNILWTPHHTPWMVKIYFRDLIQCPGAPVPPPNSMCFKAVQRVGTPCLFERYEPTGWHAWWRLFESATHAYLFWVPTGTWYFTGIVNSPAIDFFPDNLCACPTDGAEGGRCYVLVEPDDFPRAEAVALGLTRCGLTRFERQGPELPPKCLKLSEKRSATNLLIRID